MNGLSNHDETYVEYSLVPTDDLILEVKVQGCGEDVDVGAPKSIF